MASFDADVARSLKMFTSAIKAGPVHAERDLSQIFTRRFSYTLNGQTVNVMLELRNNFSLPVNYR